MQNLQNNVDTVEQVAGSGTRTMRVCMVLPGMLSFGGLEEFAKNLAVGVQREGCQVTVLSAAWVPPDNQYLQGLRAQGVRFLQLPRRLSLLVSDWDTKEKVLAVCMKLVFPLVVLLAVVAALLRRRSFRRSLQGARGWVQGQLMSRIIGPDRRKPFVNLMLAWLRLRWRPDLIHIQGYTSTLLFVIDWAHERNIPVIYEEHQTPDGQFDWWKEFKTSINKASLVIAVSEKSAEALREVAGVTRPISVAYYMVPDPAETGWSFTPPPGSADGTIRLTTPARLYVTKGLTYLLDAIPLVRAAHPGVQFRVYGDGPLREELLDYAAGLGLDGKEIFSGAYTSREQLSNIMAQTDIFVMSSILEGLPISLLEAMSYGRPVVVTPVGGIPEAITDGLNGLLCEPRDPRCLAEKINRLIEDPELRGQLGRRARKAYEEGPYHPAAVSQQFLSIYRAVLQPGRGN